MLSEYNKNYKWKSSPKEWTFPLEECLFSGMKVWCPAHPEKLVSNMYEEISVEISSIKCINGSWTKLDEHRSVETKTTMNNQETSTEQMTTS
ncbi:unnamed protein product, partial [Rotaria sp. Silwood1]